MWQPDNLLVKVRENDPNLRAEDAFVLPAWFSQSIRGLENNANQIVLSIAIPLAIRIRGPLDAEALERSIRGTLKRHEVFRPVFRIVDSDLVQIVTEPEMPAIRLFDLSTFDQSARESQVSR
jgi:hypothetical protein